MQYINIGNFIKKKRLSLKKSLNSFAIQNDIEPAILCRIENQKQDIKLATLSKIAKGFSMSTSKLLEEYEKLNAI